MLWFLAKCYFSDQQVLVVIRVLGLRHIEKQELLNVPLFKPVTHLYIYIKAAFVYAIIAFFN